MFREQRAYTVDSLTLLYVPHGHRLIFEHMATRRSFKATRTSTDAGESSPAVHTQQNEQWSWAEGGFQCFQGDTVVKTQNETPADVWVYLVEGWPGEESKQWRRWSSRTQQMNEVAVFDSVLRSQPSS